MDTASPATAAPTRDVLPWAPPQRLTRANVLLAALLAVELASGVLLRVAWEQAEGGAGSGSRVSAGAEAP